MGDHCRFPTQQIPSVFRHFPTERVCARACDGGGQQEVPNVPVCDADDAASNDRHRQTPNHAQVSHGRQHLLLGWPHLGLPTPCSWIPPLLRTHRHAPLHICPLRLSSLCLHGQ